VRDVLLRDALFQQIILEQIKQRRFTATADTRYDFYNVRVLKLNELLHIFRPVYSLCHIYALPFSVFAVAIWHENIITAYRTQVNSFESLSIKLYYFYEFLNLIAIIMER